MEVKVDSGSEPNCIPLSHFRHLFPQLCSEDGNPRENALEATLAQFEAYDGGILQAQMDHVAYSGHQQREEVSSCEILCCGQLGGQDNDKPCYSNLVGPHEGPIQEQSIQDQKASSICF